MGGLDHARLRPLTRRAAVAALLTLLPALAAGAPMRAPAAVRSGTAAAPASPPSRHLVVLCYHDLTTDPKAPTQNVTPDFLREQIRTCRREGWTIVPLGQVLANRDHPERLPARTLVLTFDDGYKSFRELALPILREERAPATVAVITSFVGHDPPELPPVMDWNEVREVARDPLVTVASHAHALHRFDFYNPYRDTAPAFGVRRWINALARYESRDEYRARIRTDLDSTQLVLRRELGAPATVLAWPYGAHTEMARGAAALAGFRASLALDDREVTPADLRAGCLPRIMVTKWLRFTTADFAWWEAPAAPLRAAEVDLDDVWDPDLPTFRVRVDSLVARVRALGAWQVYLTACSGTRAGRPDGAYFKSHQAPVRGDVFSLVAAKLQQARIHVWARVPVMALGWTYGRRPDLRLRRDGGDDDPRGVAARWPERLSPDLPEARQAAVDFVTDLAVYEPLDGVLFDSDAAIGADERLVSRPTAGAAAKAAAIDSVVRACRDAVRAWRPECEFARAVDASVAINAGVQPTRAQEFGAAVRGFDVVVVDASRALDRGTPAGWLERAGRRAAARRDAIAGGPGRLPQVALELAGRGVDPARLRGLAARALGSGVDGIACGPVGPRGPVLPAGLLEAPAPKRALAPEVPMR